MRPMVRLLSEREVDALARYNSERERGIVHTAEWQQKMWHLQKIFDVQVKRVYLVKGERVWL